MARRAYIQNIITTRINLRQKDTRNCIRTQLQAIENSAGPVPPADALRPFMIPRGQDPLNIWRLILDWITEPQDILNLWEVCDLFRAILRPKYIQARLPQIARIAFDNDPVFSGRKDERLVNSVYREISRPNLELLKLRRISLLCKNSTEVLLQSKVLLSLENVEQVQKTVDKILGGALNPDLVYPGCLQVNDLDFLDPDYQEIKEFSELVEILLELTGHRVTSLIYISHEKIAVMYENLAKWMLFLPNLQALELNYDDHGEPVQDFEEVHVPTFPTCPQLRSFAQTGSKLSEAYVQRIIVANPFLTTLIYPENCGDDDDDFMHPPEMNLRLERLECFHTPLYPALLRYHRYQMPLKEIVILPNLWFVEFDERFTFAQLRAFLNQFRDTLERLELGWYDWHAGNTEDELLDLPNLKCFRFKYHKRSFPNLNGILLAGQLQEVGMVVSADDRGNDSQRFVDSFCGEVTTGFGGFSMWEVFPGLRKFVVQFQDDEGEVDSTIEVLRPNNGMH